MIVQIARGMLTNRNPQHSFNNQYKTLLHYYCADCLRDADQQESATQFQQPIKNTLYIITVQIACETLTNRNPRHSFNSKKKHSYIITVQIAGEMTKKAPGLPSSWRPVWLLSVGIVFTEAVFYVVFASGELQPWNTPAGLEEHNREKREKDMEKDDMVVKA